MKIIRLIMTLLIPVLFMLACGQQQGQEEQAMETEPVAQKTVSSAAEQAAGKMEEMGSMAKEQFESYSQLLAEMGEEKLRNLIRQQGLKALKDKLGQMNFEQFLSSDGFAKLGGLLDKEAFQNMLKDPLLDKMYDQQKLSGMLEQQNVQGMLPPGGLEAMSGMEQMKQSETQYKEAAEQAEKMSATGAQEAAKEMGVPGM